MKKEQILSTIVNLSKSQGFYCRVLEQIRENPTILDSLESENFADSLDLVLFLEC